MAVSRASANRVIDRIIVMIAWTLLRLNPQSQQRYVEHIAEYVPEVVTYYPTYTRVVRPSGLRHPIQRILPVFAGYVFARVDMDSSCVHRLVSAPIRAYYIKLKALPEDERTISTIPDKVIDMIKHMEVRNMLVTESVRENPYLPGRKIMIHHTSFDLCAVIVMLRRGEVIADTSLGRVRVPVHTVTLA